MASKKGENRMERLEKEMEGMREGFQKSLELLKGERRLEKEAQQRAWEES